MLFPTMATDKNRSHDQFTPKRKAIGGIIAKNSNYNNGGVHKILVKVNFITFSPNLHSSITRRARKHKYILREMDDSHDKIQKERKNAISKW